jgi:hypothetical protein
MTAWQAAIDASIAGRIYSTSIECRVNEFDELYADICAETLDADHDGPVEPNHPDQIGRRVDLWGETLQGERFRIKITLTEE